MYTYENWILNFALRHWVMVWGTNWEAIQGCLAPRYRSKVCVDWMLIFALHGPLHGRTDELPEDSWMEVQMVLEDRT